MNFIRSRAGVAALSIGLSLALTQFATAQRGRGLFGGPARIQLCTLEQVQADLKLTDDQKKLAEEINQKLNDDRRGLFQGGGGGGDFAAMREKMEKMNDEASAKLTEKLDDAQRKRLTELYVQTNGTSAIVDKEVSEALKVTPEQAKSLAEASDKNRQDRFGAFRDFQDMSDDERQKASEKLAKEGDERMLAVLTNEQREAFGAMKGKELEIDISPLFRGRRGGGGQGRQGGGGRPGRPE
jgi:hypothetical protein